MKTETPEWPKDSQRHVVKERTYRRLEVAAANMDRAEQLLVTTQAHFNNICQTIADEAGLGEFRVDGLDDSVKGEFAIIYRSPLPPAAPTPPAAPEIPPAPPAPEIPAGDQAAPDVHADVGVISG
jgi:hypothetical protein